MNNKILYFLSYADSFEENIKIGHLDRLVKEVNYLSGKSGITIFSKDCLDIHKQVKGRLNESIALRGLPFSIFGSRVFKGAKGLVRKLCSVFIYFEYQIMVPFLYVCDFKAADIFYARHISAALAGVVCKNTVNRDIKLVVRLYWSWSEYNLKENSKFYYAISAMLERFILKNCDCLVLAPGESKDRIKLFDSKRKIRVEYLPNWIDTNIFSPDNNVDKEYDVVFLGRLEQVKNPLLFLEAVYLANKNITPGLKILCIGGGALKEEVIRFCRQKNIDITMIEAVPNSKLPDYLRRCRVYCITSTHEGCPKALLEAMACGLICIGTRAQGIAEIIRDGYNGFLVGADAGSLMVKIIDAVKKYNSYFQIRENARKFIGDSYSFEKVITKLECVLAGHNKYAG